VVIVLDDYRAYVAGDGLPVHESDEEDEA